MNREKIKQLAIDTLRIEADAITALVTRIDDRFVRACEILLSTQGRVVVMGMGKSGHVGRKIAATFASTGTPAYFVHPAEASHGDLGMITADDTILAISNSGETAELLSLLSVIKLLGIPLITLTGNPHSTLAREATVNLNIAVEKEACPLQLAPTASTTATLAMGDALAIALLDANAFTSDDFAFSHPGGHLGQRLLVRTESLMITGEGLPLAQPHTQLKDALHTIALKRLGHLLVVNEHHRLLGIVSDGDIRRAFAAGKDAAHTTVGDIMTTPCKSILPTLLATEALRQMELASITGLPVVDTQHTLLGFLHLHDILRAGMVIK